MQCSSSGNGNSNRNVCNAHTRRIASPLCNMQLAKELEPILPASTVTHSSINRKGGIVIYGASLHTTRHRKNPAQPGSFKLIYFIAKTILSLRAHRWFAFASLFRMPIYFSFSLRQSLIPLLYSLSFSPSSSLLVDLSLRNGWHANRTHGTYKSLPPPLLPREFLIKRLSFLLLTLLKWLLFETKVRMHEKKKTILLKYLKI